MPLNKIGSINKINKAYSFLEQQHERPPSPEELATQLEMTVSDVKQCLKNSGRHLSMDAPVKEDSDFNLHDMVSSSSEPNPDASLIDDSLSIEIERALETLPQKESDVLKLYFGLGGNMPLSLNEIGEVFDLTRERVRQIKEKAIRRLRHTSRNKILKTYLG